MSEQKYRYVGPALANRQDEWTQLEKGGCIDPERYLYKSVRGGSYRCFPAEDVEPILESVPRTEGQPAPAPKFTPPPPRSNLQWVGVDLDETLAQGIWTPENPTAEIGPPIAGNVAKVRALAAQGWKIHVHTSRPWHEVEHIKGWLRFHGVPFAGIQCGKPLYAAYIDDRAIFAGDDDWTPKSKDARVSPR